MKRIKNTKKAKFFCEFCGNEVKQNDKVCTYCGKFFASVRCPNCGKTGRTEEFTHGCPACGYAVDTTKGGIRYRGGSLNGQGGFFSRLFGYGSASSYAARKNYDGSLPFWIYIVVIAVLIALVIGLYSCL